MYGVGSIFSSTVSTGLEPDISPDEQEEKARLIAQVLELQNTLDGQYSLEPLYCCCSFFDLEHH